MSKQNLKRAGWLLTAITLVAVAALSLSARPSGPVTGEWTRTSLSYENRETCVGGTCHEWCVPLGSGHWGELIPTGVLCCLDANGDCPPGGEFSP